MSWTPVADALPDDGETVLIFLRLDLSESIWTGYQEGDDWWDAHGVYLDGVVTHWMPLPEPPNQTPIEEIPHDPNAKDGTPQSCQCSKCVWRRLNKRGATA